MSEPNTSKFRAFSNPVFICLLLAAATFLVFWPVTHCDFLNYDDPDYFTANPHVLNGLTLSDVFWAFTTGHAGNWHPLTWLSLMLDADLFGKKSFGPHLINLIFHTANAVLLFILLRRLTAATWRSAIAAAFFALHPLHVESVAWVAERKDVLSTFFALLSLLTYAKYAEMAKAGDSEREKFHMLSLVFFALGLMSKPMLVTLPFVMLLLDWWPFQRISSSEFQISNLRRLILEKKQFLALSAVSCVITFIVQQESGAVAALNKFSVAERIENAFVSYARYLGKTFWPDSLAIPYPHPGHWELSLVIYSVALVVGLSAIAVLFARRFPFVFTGWFWFVGTLIPVIGLVQVGDAAMADRYTYFPLVGIFIILIWSANLIVADWRVPAQLMIFPVVILLVACAIQTRNQLNYWQNSGTLFRHTLAVTENNYVACNNYGTWLSRNGDIAGAMNYFHQSLEIKPVNPDAFYNLGNVFAKSANWDGAISNYQSALKITPNAPDILNNLGFAFAARNQFAEAITNFETALTLNPDLADAHNNFAAVLFRLGNYDGAARHFYAALQIEPDNLLICANLGDALAAAGNKKAAAECYQQVLQLEPDNSAIKNKLQALGVRP